jgi:hypothetical protein
MISLQSLDIVIGMVVVFLTVSMVCSSINELIAATLALRASTLKSALESLLGSDLAKKVMNHPTVPAAPNGGKKNPSYIDPALFASALLDSVVTAPGVEAAAQAAAAQAPAPSAQIAAAQAAISQLAGNATTPKDRAPFDALLALLRAANGDYAKLQKQIATWFDAYMDRVGGEYKRRSQIVLAVIAIFVVGILNIDSFKVFKQLTSQPAVATALANRAEPLLRNRNAAPAGTSVGSKIDQVNAQIAAIPVPIGWHLGPSQDDRGIPPWQKFFGLLITAIAASLGAPFWFDTLSKLANLRSTGDKPGDSTQPSGS